MQELAVIWQWKTLFATEIRPGFTAVLLDLLVIWGFVNCRLVFCAVGSLILEDLVLRTLVYCSFEFSRQVIGDVFYTTFDLPCCDLDFATWALEFGLEMPVIWVRPFTFRCNWIIPVKDIFTFAYCAKDPHCRRYSTTCFCNLFCCISKICCLDYLFPFLTLLDLDPWGILGLLSSDQWQFSQLSHWSTWLPTFRTQLSLLQD